MIVAICLGRGGSKGMPGKNKYVLNGKPIMAYPLIAARDCKEINRVFFSTEDQELKGIAEYYEAEIIDRPKELATDRALGEDVFIHAYDWFMKKNYYVEEAEEMLLGEVEFVVLLFANAPCIASGMVSEMIKELRNKPYYDSVCTISKYNMFSPYRMRRDKGSFGIVNFVRPIDFLGVDCDRNSSGDFWIYDCSCAVVRPECIEDIEYGYPPQRWLGRKILGYKQEIPALDLDYKYQIGQIQYWLDNQGKNKL